MGDTFKKLTEFVIDDAKFEEYKAKIEAAKAAKRPEVFRKPARNSGLLEKQVRQALELADEAFECSEWLEAGRMYLELNDAKVGPQGIEVCPVESASYLAMGLIKEKLRSHKEASLWLKLAKLALRPNAQLIADAEHEVEVCSAIHESEIRSFRSLMKNRPDWIEVFESKDDFYDIEDYNGLIEAFKRVRANPESLEKEMNEVPDLQPLVWGNWANTEDTFPRRFSEEHDRKHAQSDCAAHSMNGAILKNIASYLDLPSLSYLAQTCKFFEHLCHMPVIYENIYERLGLDPLPEYWWGLKRKPWYWIGAMRVLKLCVDFLRNMVGLAREYSELDVPSSSASYYSLRSKVLLSLHLKHHLFVNLKEALSTKFAWVTIADSFLVISPLFRNSAAFIIANDFWLALNFAFADNTVPHYMDQVPSMITAYIGAQLCGGPFGPDTDFSVHFYCLLTTLLHNEASAAMAVCLGAKRLVEMNFQPICDTKETIQRMPSSQVDNRFDMNGIWQGVMHYSMAPLDITYSEEMIMKLKFPPASSHTEGDGGPMGFEMIGSGYDSLGEFELEDATVDQLRFVINFVKVYKNTFGVDGSPLKHAYEGVIYPYGIGGHFGTLPDEMGIKQIGYFFIGRPAAYSGGSLATAASRDDVKEVSAESWDSLIDVIKHKKEANEKLKTKKCSDAGIPASFFDENPHAQIYDIPLSNDSDEGIMRQRQATRYLALACVESTSLSRLREALEEAQTWVEGIPSDAEKVDLKFLSDSPTKREMRKLLYSIAVFRSRSCSNYIFAENIHKLPVMAETLERHQCNPEVDEVKEILALVARWIIAVPALTQPAAIHWLKMFKKFIEHQRQFELRRLEQGDFEENDEGEDNVQRVPSSISRFMKQSGLKDSGEDDSHLDSDSDNEEDAWANRKKGKRLQKGRISTSTLILVGSIASAAIIAGAFALGRILSKHRND